jgi:hypothetical protein
MTCAADVWWDLIAGSAFEERCSLRGQRLRVSSDLVVGAASVEVCFGTAVSINDASG